jgi:hypothetical protein
VPSRSRLTTAFAVLAIAMSGCTGSGGAPAERADGVAPPARVSEESAAADSVPSCNGGGMIAEIAWDYVDTLTKPASPVDPVRARQRSDPGSGDEVTFEEGRRTVGDRPMATVAGFDRNGTVRRVYTVEEGKRGAWAVSSYDECPSPR